MKQSWAFEYQFEPGQGTKLKADTTCWMTQSEAIKDCSLMDVDAITGIARIKISDKKLKMIREEEPNWEPPSRTSLMDMTQIRTGQISDAILETVQTWKDSSELQPALADFLERSNPRVLGHAGGPLIRAGEDLLPGTLRVISNLNNSCLCIQGPPGSGKTFTAAKVILSLLQQGRTVAVSANSHAVIFNLLARVQGYSEETNARFGIAQIPSSTEKAKAKAGVAFKKKITEALPPEFQLVGATVFQLCRPEAVDQFDYLFIDEAGQVSLANLVALARCASNLVLIGDPMQLEQPIQGSHPGESGESALGYLLNGKATVPEDLGIFLGVTYRMEPAIARYISEGIYEGRLRHHPDTQHHRLALEPVIGPSGWVLTRSSGIAVVPVAHQGNGQASDEEVEVIAEMVEQLLGVGYASDRGDRTGSLSLDDILIVTPYNLQAGQLRAQLGEDARIGTVDKFQGQEAPIVIISMAASTTEDAPRGIEFLLNRNRLNVAVSRAQCLAIVVASPALATASCTTLEQITQVNLFCKLVDLSSAD
ncbi:MAG: AAA family ATPase [Synechococcales cyanobacterium RM1_1_8]|nr:AAA family ATPase [Synechococcales cyanobacterium RM1_1_8]